MTMKDRTKLMFAEALEQILESKPFDKVRVLDLCKLCETTPQTFYYHLSFFIYISLTAVFLIKVLVFGFCCFYYGISKINKVSTFTFRKAVNIVLEELFGNFCIPIMGIFTVIHYKILF